MKKINILFVILIAFIAQSCYEDKGNYDYIPSNKVTITNIESVYALDITSEDSEDLVIEPKLEFESKPLTNLTYNWIINEKSVSTEPVLRISRSTITEKCSCRFEAIDPSNGNHYVFDFNIKLNSSFEEGWMLLTDNGAVNHLTFISPSVEEDTKSSNIVYKAYPNIYEKSYGTSLGTEAVRFVEHWSSSYETNLANVVLVKHDSEGSIDLNGSTFKKESNTSDYFVGNASPSGYKPIDEVYLSEASFILNEDNKLYSRKMTSPTLFQSGKFMDEPVYFEKGLEVGMFVPAVHLVTYCGLVYDKKNRRLLYADGNSQIHEINYNEYTDGQTHFDDLKKDMVTGFYYDMEPGSWGKKTKFTVVLNDNGKYSVLDFKFSFETRWGMIGGVFCSKTKLYVKEFKEFDLNVNGLIAPESIIYRPKHRSYMYFSNNDKLYAYDLKVNDTPRLLFDFNGGKISAIASGVKSNEIGVSLEDGSFYIIGSTTEDIAKPTNKPIYKYEGKDKIISVMYKYGDKYNLDLQ